MYLDSMLEMPKHTISYKLSWMMAYIIFVVVIIFIAVRSYLEIKNDEYVDFFNFSIFSAMFLGLIVLLYSILYRLAIIKIYGNYFEIINFFGLIRKRYEMDEIQNWSELKSDHRQVLVLHMESSFLVFDGSEYNSYQVLKQELTANKNTTEVPFWIKYQLNNIVIRIMVFFNIVLFTISFAINYYITNIDKPDKNDLIEISIKMDRLDTLDYEYEFKYIKSNLYPNFTFSVYYKGLDRIDEAYTNEIKNGDSIKMMIKKVDYYGKLMKTQKLDFFSKHFKYDKIRFYSLKTKSKIYLNYNDL
ncbi:MAG: hypothetical protein U0W24_04645 [Bacteroidales bacterium]